MSKIASREIRLASHPKGIPTAANFTLARVELEPLQHQQVLVRNLFMSVDPYMRGRMNEGKSSHLAAGRDFASSTVSRTRKRAAHASLLSSSAGNSP
jgi:NADPH-dependent curcumin reductase CurA